MTEIKNLARVIEEKKQTFDYQNYTTLEGVSRKVDDDHVKEIMESMAMYGAEATTIIILETEAFGEKIRINADGNHRSTSARLLGLPLDIKVVKLTDDTQENVKNFISCLNNKLKRWTNQMYLEVNVASNIREYVKFKQLIEETKLTITDLLFLYTGSGATKDFQLGKLTFKDEKESDKNKDLGEELADVVFVVLCLANQTGIDLQAAFDKKMDLKSVRDKDRHKNNEKLK